MNNPDNKPSSVKEDVTVVAPKKGNIILVYPLGITGVGKNYLFDELGRRLSSRNIKYVSIERDADLQKFEENVIKALIDHMEGDLVLVLNRNFPPNAWKFDENFNSVTIKDFTKNIGIAIPGERKRLQTTLAKTVKGKDREFDIHHLTLDFSNLPERPAFDVNDRLVSLVRMFHREHTAGVSAENPHVIIKAFYGLTSAWVPREIDAGFKGSNLYGVAESNNSLVKVKWNNKKDYIGTRLYELINNELKPGSIRDTGFYKAKSIQELVPFIDHVHEIVHLAGEGIADAGVPVDTTFDVNESLRDVLGFIENKLSK